MTHPALFKPTDLTQPGAIDALLAFHRSVFGDARMEAGDGGGAGGDGGQGATGDGQQGQQGAGGTGGQQAGQGQQQGDHQQGQPSGDAQKVEDLPDWAQRLIRDTRNDAATRRANAEQQAQQAAEAAKTELAQTIGKALGLIKDGEGDQVDVDALTRQATEAQAAQRQAAVELAVFRTAGKHQGDPDALLDSRAFLNAVKDLDPAADDFAAKVDTAIKDAVTANPKLKAGRAPGASSVDHGAGGSGEQRRTSSKPLSLDQAVTAHYGS